MHLLGHYTGSKATICRQLWDYLPDHVGRISPFGGIAADFAQWGAAVREVYNDIDFDLCNLFRIIQQRTLRRRLTKLILKTPNPCLKVTEAADIRWSKDSSLVRRAWAMLVLMNGAMLEQINWRHPSPDERNKRNNENHYWNNLPDALAEYAIRFRKVEVCNEDARAIIRRHDRPENLIFVDPPYIQAQRRDLYRHEYQEHGALSILVSVCKARVIFVEYDHPIYNYWLDGWERWDSRKLATYPTAEKSNTKYTQERIWTNFPLGLPDDGHWVRASSLRKGSDYGKRSS